MSASGLVSQQDENREIANIRRTESQNFSVCYVSSCSFRCAIHWS